MTRPFADRDDAPVVRRYPLPFVMVDKEAVLDLVRQPARDGHPPGAPGVVVYVMVQMLAAPGAVYETSPMALAPLVMLPVRTTRLALHRLVDVGLLVCEGAVDKDDRPTDATTMRYRVVRVY